MEQASGSAYRAIHGIAKCGGKRIGGIYRWYSLTPRYSIANENKLPTTRNGRRLSDVLFATLICDPSRPPRGKNARPEFQMQRKTRTFRCVLSTSQPAAAAVQAVAMLLKKDSM